MAGIKRVQFRRDCIQSRVAHGNVVRIDINADPSALPQLCHPAGRSTADERIKYPIFWIGTRLYDAIEERLRLLRGMSLAFRTTVVDMGKLPDIAWICA